MSSSARHERTNLFRALWRRVFRAGTVRAAVVPHGPQGGLSRTIRRAMLAQAVRANLAQRGKAAARATNQRQAAQQAARAALRVHEEQATRG